jgi:hypothetical protein
LKAKFCLVAVLLMFFSLIGIVSVLVTPVAATDPVIVGKWDRTDGSDKYTIYANGLTETVLPDGIHHGTWEMEGSSGYKYIFRWDFGPSGKAQFVDYVTVAADGQSYSGVNNYGDDFHCVRVGSADSTPPVDSGFPIFYVAVGGGIAAIVLVGAAVYFFFIAGAGAGATAGSAGYVLGGAVGGAAAGTTGGASWIGIEPDIFADAMSNVLSDTISDIVNDVSGGVTSSAASGLSGSTIPESNVESLNDMIASTVIESSVNGVLSSGGGGAITGINNVPQAQAQHLEVLQVSPPPPPSAKPPPPPQSPPESDQPETAVV